MPLIFFLIAYILLPLHNLEGSRSQVDNAAGNEPQARLQTPGVGGKQVIPDSLDAETAAKK